MFLIYPNEVDYETLYQWEYLMRAHMRDHNETAYKSLISSSLM